MAMQIRPSKASNITIFVGTIIPQKKNCVFENNILFIFDTQVLVNLDKIGVVKILKAFLSIIGEYHKRRFCLEFMFVKYCLCWWEQDLLCNVHKL